MSVDTSTIQINIMFLGMWFECILEIILSIYFLYDILGYATFAGCGVLILMMLINILSSSRIVKMLQSFMKVRDERVNILSEVINGIKVIMILFILGYSTDKYVDVIGFHGVLFLLLYALGSLLDIPIILYLYRNYEFDQCSHFHSFDSSANDLTFNPVIPYT
jgi:hypothetical protein